MPVDEVYDQAELKYVIRKMLIHMRPREARFLRLRFGLDGPELTLAAIGNQEGISGPRVRQICETALRRLRRPRRANVLRLFHVG